MTIEKIRIEEVKPNPSNPRTIKDDKYKKLVKSIKEFPEMLDVRPIVVDDDMVVLGGNMRLKACKEAGLVEVSIIKFKDLSEDKKKEFIVKDNVGYGEWDFDLLLEDWDKDLLIDWGMDLPEFDDLDNNDNNNKKEPKDLSNNITTMYRLEVILTNEREQEILFNELKNNGYECRILTL